MNTQQKNKKTELPRGFRYRRNGSLEYRFTIDGERCSAYGQSVEECLQKETQRRRESILGAGAMKTVAEYFDYWNHQRIGTVRSATISTQTAQIKTILQEPIGRIAFGQLNIKDVTAQHLRQLQRSLSRRFHSNTVNQYMSLIKSIFETAVQEQLLLFNPAASLRRLQQKEVSARESIHRALTAEETACFLRQAEGTRYCELYRFLLNTGCRCGEAAALRQSDISGTTLQIRRTLTRTEDGNHIVGKEPKTRQGKRTIPLRIEAMKALQAQLAINRKNPSKYENACIFQSPQGAFLPASIVNVEIRKICIKAGLEPFTTHAFRATFATRAIESGMNPKTLQEILGHSDFGITMNLYCHCMEETKQREMLLVDLQC